MIDTENATHLSHNQLLQGRRDAGELNVPANETLLPCLSTPDSDNSLSTAKTQQWIAAYSVMTPRSRAWTLKALDAIKPVDPVTLSFWKGDSNGHRAQQHLLWLRHSP